MGQDLIRDGKLDRQAAGEALRQFLEEIVRVSGLDLKVKVQVVDAACRGRFGWSGSDC